MAKKATRVVISYFPGKDQAATAADELKDWDKANDDIQLGGIGILTWKRGKIKTHKLSRVRAGKGAKWGLGLGAVAGILSGGVTLIAGAVGGAAVGAVGAKLFHQNLGLSDEDRARIEQHLSDGEAALVVMAAEDEVEATKSELAALGGHVEDYQVPEALVEQIEAASDVEVAAEQQPEETEEQDEPEEAAESAEAGAASDEDAPPTVVKLTGTLESVEGIGPAYVAALQGIGITTKRRLLLAGATAEGRAKVAEQSKISEKLVTNWVSAVDLSRITGVKAQNAELLVAAGVQSVGGLAAQEAEALQSSLSSVNAEKKLVRVVPGTSQVTRWIEEAKSLPQMVNI